MGNVLFEFMGISFTWEGIGITAAAFFSLLSVAGNIVQYIHKKRNFKEKNNIEYITNKRVDWIYAVRQAAAAFIAKAHVLSIKTELEPADIYELNEHLYLVELYLNYNGIVDGNLVNIMYKIVEDIKKHDHEGVNAYAQLFCNHLRIYLKVEWDRVKAETNGEKYDKERNLKELLKAYKKYDETAKNKKASDIKTTIQMLNNELTRLQSQKKLTFPSLFYISLSLSGHYKVWMNLRKAFFPSSVHLYTPAFSSTRVNVIPISFFRISITFSLVISYLSLKAAAHAACLAVFSSCSISLPSTRCSARASISSLYCDTARGDDIRQADAPQT